MADTMPAATIAALGSGNLDLTSGTFRLYAVGSGYTYNSASHDFLDDVTGAARIANVNLSSVTFSGGVFDAADATFTAVAGGSTITQLVIVKWSGVESTSRIIYHINSYGGLPASTGGTDINVAFPNDANKIFSIANA